MRRLAGGLIAALLTGVASAEPTAERDEAPTAAYGAAHPDCLAWSDACIVCRKQEDDDPACSTAGVDCAPTAPKCLETVESTPQGR